MRWQCVEDGKCGFQGKRGETSPRDGLGFLKEKRLIVGLNVAEITSIVQVMFKKGGNQEDVFAAEYMMGVQAMSFASWYFHLNGRFGTSALL